MSLIGSTCIGGCDTDACSYMLPDPLGKIQDQKQDTCIEWPLSIASLIVDLWHA